MMSVMLGLFLKEDKIFIHLHIVEVCSTINSKPTTLILSPSGNLVQSTISILQKPVGSLLKKSQVS